MTTTGLLSKLLDVPISQEESQESQSQTSDGNGIEDERSRQIKEFCESLSEEEVKTFLLKQTSYSGVGEFRSCERKYFLDKLTTGDRDNTIDTAFGSAVGAGTQTLWLTGDEKRAKFAAFHSWSVEFSESKDSKKKSIGWALRAIEAYIPIYNILSQDYEIATINGQNAVEFSLLVEFPGSFRYRSYVDLILRHKETGELSVTELKTTGSTWAHEAQYKNSDQGTSYGLVIDQVEEEVASFWIKYFAYYSTMQKWESYEFPKHLLDKAKWLKTTMQDMQDIQRCIDTGYWPMRGSNCMSFGKPCRYFDVCQMNDRALVAPIESLREKLSKELSKEYSFKIPVETIIERYLT